MRYRGRGVATEDLFQVAYEGLTKAVQRFDAERRKDLLTFAVPTIRGELQRYFRDLGWTVRPPRRIQELQGRANQTFARLSQDLGREPTPDEVAAELGITPQEYRDSEAALGCFTPTSLDQPAGESTATVGDPLRAFVLTRPPVENVIALVGLDSEGRIAQRIPFT